MTERFPADAELQDAWDAYLDAYDLAHQSRDIQDGITAGRFWAKWLEMFDARRRATGDGRNVVRLQDFQASRRLAR